MPPGSFIPANIFFLRRALTRLRVNDYPVFNALHHSPESQIFVAVLLPESLVGHYTFGAGAGRSLPQQH